VTAGSVLDGTKVPPRTWIAAERFVAGQKTGTSDIIVHGGIDIGSYPTMCLLLHKRLAMVVPGQNRLRRTVEVDETYQGAVEEAVSGR
jgi:hypothetical protein